MNDKQFWRIVLLIVLMTAAGQFANTIYVPAINQMAHFFNRSNETIQTLKVAYLLPYGMSQFIYGPASDRFGRRPAVLVGLGIFCFGSFLTVISSEFNLLYWGCFLQGLGAGVGGVMAHTVMKDCYADQQLYRANTIISAVLVIAPLLAPIMGAFISTHFAWKANFIFLLIFALAVWLIQWFYFTETHPLYRRQRHDPWFFISSFRFCFSHRLFLLYATSLALSFGCVAVFEASANNLFIRLLHYSPASIGVVFVVPLIPYIFGTIAAKHLQKLLTFKDILIVSLAFIGLGSFGLTVPALEHFTNSYSILLPVMFTLFGTGILFPTAVTGAMNPMGHIAGTAGAVLGGLQNMGAALMTLGFAHLQQTSGRPLAFVFDLATLSIAVLVFFIIKLETQGQTP